jgi:hypothetical protein
MNMRAGVCVCVYIYIYIERERERGDNTGGREDMVVVMEETSVAATARTWRAGRRIERERLEFQ